VTAPPREMSSVKRQIRHGGVVAVVDGGVAYDNADLAPAMWTNPGEGYCYSSQGVHVASVILRRLAGMEMEEYIRQKLAARLGFGGWGYAMQQANGKKLEHTPGGGGIALRATDALRFAYLLLRNGYWGR